MHRYLSAAFSSRSGSGRKGLVRAAAIAALLTFVSSGFAATPAPSKASLDGVYVFHFTSTKEVYWSASKVCHYATGNYTYTGGGQSVDTEVVTGEATFDGAGSVTFKFTQNRSFNAAASNATVEITCPSKAGGPANITSGQMVLDPATNGSFTGSYTVTTAGAATVTLPAGAGDLELSLAALNTAGLSTTFLINNPDGSDSYLVGIGVHK